MNPRSKRTIKECLQSIEKQDKIIEKLAKFLTTKRGQTFVSKLHTAPFRELCKRYDVPKFVTTYKNRDRWNMNLIKAAIRKYEIDIPKETYSAQYTNEWVRTPVYLDKKELRKITDKYHRKMGFAALMHAYEEHKMEKFKAKHPAPTAKQLMEDLFPNELINAYENMIDTARYKIRQQVVSARCKLSLTGRYKISDGKYVTRPITKIKDIDGGGHRINHLSKEHALIRKVQDIADTVYKEDNSLVYVRIQGHYQQGRLILPKKAA